MAYPSVLVEWLRTHRLVVVSLTAMVVVIGIWLFVSLVLSCRVGEGVEEWFFLGRRCP